MSDLADYIRDQVCCPRIHGCELDAAPECPAEQVRLALKLAHERIRALEAERRNNETFIVDLVQELRDLQRTEGTADEP